eukprot:3995650-Amphidinium_carterae.1
MHSRPLAPIFAKSVGSTHSVRHVVNCCCVEGMFVDSRPQTPKSMDAMGKERSPPELTKQQNGCKGRLPSASCA